MACSWAGVPPFRPKLSVPWTFPAFGAAASPAPQAASPTAIPTAPTAVAPTTTRRVAPRAFPTPLVPPRAVIALSLLICNRLSALCLLLAVRAPKHDPGLLAGARVAPRPIGRPRHGPQLA